MKICYALRLLVLIANYIPHFYTAVNYITKSQVFLPSEALHAVHSDELHTAIARET